MTFIVSVSRPSVDIDALCELETTEEQIAFEHAFQKADAENYATNPDGSQVWSNCVFNDGDIASKPLHIDAALAAVIERLNDEEDSCGEAEPFEMRDEGDHYLAVGYMHSAVIHYADGSTVDL